MLVRRWGLLFLIVLVSVLGCESRDDLVFTGTSTQDSGVLPLSGKLFLGVQVPGATVELLAPDGGVLAQTVTDASGNFFFQRPEGLAAFRVKATLAGSSLAFTRDVQVSGSEVPFLVVNVPSTLVGQLLSSGQQTDLAAAEAQVAAALGLSPEALAMLEESRRSPFSHLGFFLTIAQQGGFGDFSVSSLLAQGETAPPYLHTLETLDQPWAALEQELVDLLEPTRQRSLVFVGGSLLSSSAGLLGGIFQGLGSKVVSNAEEATLTWTGHLLGFNYGINAQFQMINQKLDALAAGIEALSDQLTNSTFSTANSLISPYISNLQTLQTQADQAARVSQLTDLPQKVPPDTATYLSSVGSFTAQAALLDIQKACLGTNGATNLVTLGAAISLEDYNFSPTDQPFVSLLGMPVRSNALLDKALTTYQSYAGYQTMAANYLGENVHTPANALSMVTLTRTASDTTNQAAYSLALQRQQLPRYLPSDNVLVDLQNGIMWYLPIQDKMNWSQARSFALSFNLAAADGVTYTQWHLPTEEEFKTLQTRGRLVKKSAQDTSIAKNSDGGEGDYGRSTQGVSALGFNNAGVFNSDGDLWMTQYSPLVDNIPSSQTQNVAYFRLNHQHSNVKGAKASDEYPVILCRSILNGPAVIGQNVAPVVYPEVDFIGPDLRGGQPLQAGEVAALGQLAAIGSPSPDTGSSTPTFPLTYTITLGGQFRAGTSSVGQDENLRTATYNIQVNSNQSHTVEPNSNSTTLAQVLSYLLEESQNLFVPYVEVSNFDGSPGQMTNHTNPGGGPAQVTLKAQSFGANASGLVTLEGSGPVTVSPSNRQLVSLLITPRNVLFDSDNSGQTQDFLAVGFYDDLTVEDLTQEATWTLTDPGGNPVPGTAAKLSTSPLGTLEILSSQVPQFSINASIPGGPQDSTLVQVTTF